MRSHRENSSTKSRLEPEADVRQPNLENIAVLAEAEQTMGLPPRPASSKNPQAQLLSQRARPPTGATPVSNNLFDHNRIKRDEISQFLE